MTWRAVYGWPYLLDVSELKGTAAWETLDAAYLKPEAAPKQLTAGAYTRPLFGST
jgi:hypothetical protein